MFSVAREVGVFVATALIASAACADFVPGDIYLSSSSYPGRTVPVQAIVRIDPLTGAKSILTTLPNLFANATTYDPFRDRILVRGVSGAPLGAIDSAGTLTLIPGSSGAAWGPLAAAGDGRVYGSGPGSIPWLDAANSYHVLFDTDGVTVFVPGVASPRSSIFLKATNQLLIVGNEGVSTRIVRIPLSADGSKVQGTVTSVLVDLVPGDFEVAQGISNGPNGKIFIAFDINSAPAGAPLLALLDPVTLTPSIFATCSYPTIAGQESGTYSVVRGQGLAVNTFDDKLRAWSLGENSDGFVLADGVSSAGGSNELHRLFEIGGTVVVPAPKPGDLDHDGDVDAADLAILLGAWGPCPGDCPADLDGDGDVDAADLAMMLGFWGS